MTKEELIQFFKEGDFSEVSREAVLQHLFQTGQIAFSDFLELQKFLEFSQMPILIIPESVERDAEKWTEYSRRNKILVVK